MIEKRERVSVLFVCMGNICRSPAAEGVFTHLVEKAGRSDEFEIDSAGTIGYHAGSPADTRMMEAAAKRGYELSSISRRITPNDFERFDWILVMDEDNYRDVIGQHKGGGAHITRMCDFCVDHRDTEVPDPYYGGAAGFEKVLDILEDACGSFLRQL